MPRRCGRSSPRSSRAARPRAWVNLGLALSDQGRFDEGYAAFATVLPPAQARANVGVALACGGLYERAEATLRQALDEDATLPQAQVALRRVEEQLRPPATRPAGDGGAT